MGCSITPPLKVKANGGLLFLTESAAKLEYNKTMIAISIEMGLQL